MPVSEGTSIVLLDGSDAFRRMTLEKSAQYVISQHREELGSRPALEASSSSKRWRLNACDEQGVDKEI